MSALVNGDSVLVTGTVQEQFDVTRLGNITAVVKVSSGNPEPAAVVRTTGNLNVANGAASAEAYEGMLVKLRNARVVDVNPTF
jgi:predicted extracellular nuclease